MKDDNSDKLVVKHNKLIEFKGRMSVNELKLFSLIIADIREHQETTLQEYHIDISILKKATKHKDFYNYMKDVAIKLEQKRIIVETINDSGKRESYPIRLIYRPKIVEDSKHLELYLDKDLIPYIIDLKREFTRYQIENILILKSSYSVRMYELLKQYQNIGKRCISINDLRDYLGIDKDEYNRFYDFEKRVLTISKCEINKHTDINIDYQKNKKGRTISSITFSIKSKCNDIDYIKYLNESYDIAEFKLKSGLKDENFNSKQIIELFTIATEVLTDPDQQDIFEYIKLNYLHILKNKTVVNKYAYLKKALNEDYAAARGQIKLSYIL